MFRLPHARMLATAAAFAALALASPAVAGKVTTSIRLPVEGDVVVDPETVVPLAGVVHVVAQTFETADGELYCAFRVNLAQLAGEDDMGGGWVGVGASQHPPNPCIYGDHFSLTAPFTLIPLGEGHPPDPGTPPEIWLELFIDRNGRLDPALSEAAITPTRG